MNIASNELRNSKRKINDIALSLGYRIMDEVNQDRKDCD